MSRTLPDPVGADDVLHHVGPSTDVILPLANGEPVACDHTFS